jgi:hypothetical protein
MRSYHSNNEQFYFEIYLEVGFQNPKNKAPLFHLNNNQIKKIDALFHSNNKDRLLPNVILVKLTRNSTTEAT